MTEQRVESVERALSLLECFNDGTERLTLAQLAERSGLYRSTILRLAGSLQRFGYLNREDNGAFRLGPALWRLGSLYEQSFHLADYVRPVLVELSEQTGETGVFYIREGDERICLYRYYSAHSVRLHQDEGARLPLGRGAGGRILSAYTDASGEFSKIRDAGYAISIGERDPETAGVAAPVFGINERFIGAVGVVAPVTRVGEKQAEALTGPVVDASRRLSRSLGAKSQNG